MKVRVMPLGMIGANCTIVSSEKNNAVIFDPGGEVNKILDLLKKENLTLTKILLTHGHHDHIAGVWDLIEATNCEVYIHSEDAEMLMDSAKCLCSAPLYFNFSPLEDVIKLNDMDVITQDELSFTIMHTPGHSKGSSVYLIGDIMISGDTLFELNCGRCDLYGGDYETIKKSLKRLADLDGDYTVITGHGNATKLSKERAKNPYMGNVDNDYYF